MRQALGLKEYSKRMSYITSTLTSVSEYLKEKDKKVLEELKEVRDLTEASIDKATVVVEVIKTQCEALDRVLSSKEEDHKKKWAAVEYFAAFAKDMEGKIKETETALREASTKLGSTMDTIKSIVNTLKDVHKQCLAEMQEATEAERIKAYTSALAGLAAGPLGLILAYAITVGVTEGQTIPEVQKKFDSECRKVDGYIKSFRNMLSDSETLAKRLNEKREELLDVHAKLSVAISIMDIEATDGIADFHFQQIMEQITDVHDEAKKFLGEK